VLTALWLSDPLVPLAVTVRLPVPALGAVTIKVDITDLELTMVTVAGEKLAAAPGGSPGAVSCTVPVNPAAGATVTV
jgi:hypothetical protein